MITTAFRELKDNLRAGSDEKPSRACRAAE